MKVITRRTLALMIIVAIAVVAMTANWLRMLRVEKSNATQGKPNDAKRASLVVDAKIAEGDVFRSGGPGASSRPSVLGGDQELIRRVMFDLMRQEEMTSRSVEESWWLVRLLVRDVVDFDAIAQLDRAEDPGLPGVHVEYESSLGRERPLLVFAWTISNRGGGPSEASGVVARPDCAEFAKKCFDRDVHRWRQAKSREVLAQSLVDNSRGAKLVVLATSSLGGKTTNYNIFMVDDGAYLWLSLNWFDPRKHSYLDDIIASLAKTSFDLFQKSSIGGVLREIVDSVPR